MVKTLVASAEEKNNKAFCKFLTNEKNFLIYNSFNFNDVLEKYAAVQPDVFIIGSSLGISNCIDIINRISIISDAFNSCYAIIVATHNEAINITEHLNNFSKLYKILYKPFNIQKTFDTVNEITPILNISKLTFDDIIPIFLLLNLSVSSKGAMYLMDSIIACYYVPFLLRNLETTVYKDIAMYYNTTEDKVRSNIANTLLTIDTKCIKDATNPLLKLLNYKDNTTPKQFIEILSMYFRNNKRVS